MKLRIALIALAALILVTVLYVVLAKKNTAPTPLPTGTVTISGEVVCLPVKDPSKPHIEVCAIGLKAEDGKYYGLKSQSDIFETGVYINATGTLVATDAESIYKTTADILVESYTKEEHAN